MLMTSGCIHLAILALFGGSWNGPLSLRKPILFGISGGMTAWSLAWVVTQLRSWKFDQLLISTLSISLLIEVALITLQYWRNVPSHFNRATQLDASIEFAMLFLILFATGVILYLTMRTIWLREIAPEMAIAIRGGMVLLAVSCLLGVLTSLLGEVRLSEGRSSEYWGTAGVLKFPHGVALHAIQMLPILAWSARKLKLRNSVLVLQSGLAAQVLFLLFACWQTARGRSRFDLDSVGGGIIAIVFLLSFYTAIAITLGIVNAWSESRMPPREV
jgi:hypothetical protein